MSKQPCGAPWTFLGKPFHVQRSLLRFKLDSNMYHRYVITIEQDLIEHYVFVYAGPKSISMGCPNLVQGDSNQVWNCTRSGHPMVIFSRPAHMNKHTMCNNAMKHITLLALPLFDSYWVWIHNHRRDKALVHYVTCWKFVQIVTYPIENTPPQSFNSWYKLVTIKCPTKKPPIAWGPKPIECVV